MTPREKLEAQLRRDIPRALSRRIDIEIERAWATLEDCKAAAQAEYERARAALAVEVSR